MSLDTLLERLSVTSVTSRNSADVTTKVIDIPRGYVGYVGYVEKNEGKGKIDDALQNNCAPIALCNLPVKENRQRRTIETELSDVTHVTHVTGNGPLATLRIFNRLKQAGFRLSISAGKLIVHPLSRLSDMQRAFLHAHRCALIGLLEDAAALAAALAEAGQDGIAEEALDGWGWGWERQFSASDVLIAQGLAWFASGCFYATGYGPKPVPSPLPRPQTPQPTRAGIGVTPLQAVEAVLSARNRDEFQEALARI